MRIPYCSAISKAYGGDPMWDDLEQAVMASRTWSGTYPRPNPQPVPQINRMTRSKELSENDWNLLKEIDPATVRRMLTNKFTIEGHLPLDWMNENLVSFFYLEDETYLYLDSEDDAASVKLKTLLSRRRYCY